MKKFMAIYTGADSSPNHEKWNALSKEAQHEQIAKGMKEWSQWGEKYAKSIVVFGGPLGKTKLVNAKGVSDIKNQMTGYVIIEAESHEDAAKMFLNHPHFAVFPGEAVEIMECLPLPTM